MTRYFSLNSRYLIERNLWIDEEIETMEVNNVYCTVAGCRASSDARRWPHGRSATDGQTHLCSFCVFLRDHFTPHCDILRTRFIIYLLCVAKHRLFCRRYFFKLRGVKVSDVYFVRLLYSYITIFCWNAFLRPNVLPRWIINSRYFTNSMSSYETVACWMMALLNICHRHFKTSKLDLVLEC